MNTSDLLTSEERELARLLGRPGNDAAGPSARVDADILTMARNPQAAVAAPASQPAAALPPRPQASGWGRRRRMVSSLAAVASLVLVVGLAWQLRPLPPQSETLPPAAEVAMAPTAASPAEAADASMNAADSNAAMPAAAPMVADVAQEPAAPQKPAATAPTAARGLLPAPIAEAPAPVAFESAPAPIAVAPAPPPPAPPAAPAAATQLDEVVTPQQASPTDVVSAQPAARSRSLPPRPDFNGPAIVPHAGAKATAKAAEARLERAQAADVSADAGLSRRQWIKRIRERSEQGDREGARASLQRFIHDYPEAHVPADLRPLLEP